MSGAADGSADLSRRQQCLAAQQQQERVQAGSCLLVHRGRIGHLHDVVVDGVGGQSQLAQRTSKGVSAYSVSIRGGSSKAGGAGCLPAAGATALGVGEGKVWCANRCEDKCQRWLACCVGKEGS